MAEELSRTVAMWVEAGIQFRANMLHEVGAKVVLHKHDFDHVSLCTHGWLKVIEIDIAGNLREYQIASKGYKPTRTDIEFKPETYRINIRAGHQHAFECLELQDMPAEMLCIYPA